MRKKRPLALKRCRVVFLLGVAGLIALLAGPGAGQTIPLADKAAYDKFLADQLSEVLERLLGPNQYNVVVDATIDFSRTESVEVTSKGSRSAESAARKGEEDVYLWQQIISQTEEEGTDQPVTIEQFLPGIPIPIGKEGGTEQKIQKQIQFPRGFLKKLAVTVVVSDKVLPAKIEKIRSILADVLGIDPKRGDVLMVVSAPFAPVWKTVWYTPESMALVYKYGVLTMMTLLALGVVGVGFLKLAGAMSSMARSQEHHVSMEIPSPKGITGAEPEMEGLPQESGTAGLLEGPASQVPRAAQAEVVEPGDDEYIKVKPEQLDILSHLLAKEKPSNIALVVTHLKPDVRQLFMALLPADKRADVIMEMSRVRFVEPQLILDLKAELERKLQGAVGGARKVMDIIEMANPREKKETLERLQQKNPILARELRRRILLLEDLVQLADGDWRILLGGTRLEDWGTALWDAPEALRERLKSQLPEHAWTIVEQLMASGKPSQGDAQKAEKNLIGFALKLIRQGKISNPLSDSSKLIE